MMIQVMSIAGQNLIEGNLVYIVMQVVQWKRMLIVSHDLALYHVETVQAVLAPGACACAVSASELG